MKRSPFSNSKFVERVTVISGGEGGFASDEVYRLKKGKRRRLSRWAKPVESPVPQSLQAQNVFGSVLLDRSSRSNRKRRNGFLRDGLVNTACSPESREKTEKPLSTPMTSKTLSVPSKREFARRIIAGCY